MIEVGLSSSLYSMLKVKATLLKSLKLKLKGH